MGVWIETARHPNTMKNTPSHPSWVCGLKQVNTLKGITLVRVTPFVGVWIETAKLLMSLGYGKSHPSWVCGLKQPFAYEA